MPRYRVKNVLQLETLLKEMYEGRHGNGAERGMKVDHLKQSYKTVLDDVKQLQRQKKAVIIPIEGKTKERPGIKHDRYAGMIAEDLQMESIVFYRVADMELTVDKDLLEKWRDSSVQGKNEEEIKRSLEMAGQPLQQTERKVDPNQGRRKKRGRRRGGGRR